MVLALGAALKSGIIPPLVGLLLTVFSVGLWGVSNRTFQKPWRVGGFFVSALVVIFLALILRLAWSPPTIAGMCMSVVYAGLFLGRRAVTVIIVLYAIAFAFGGYCVYVGWLIPQFLPAMDPGRVSNWWRIGTAVTAISLAAAWALRRVVVRLDAAWFDEQSALRAAKTEMELAERAREQRLSSELALRNTQKLQTVAQLGSGFAHLFNNVLTIVRSALDEAMQANTREELKSAATAIVDAAALGAAKTRDLLALSRPHVDQDAQISVRSELTVCCQKATDRLRDNVKLVIGEVVDGRVPLSASWFEQLLMNLFLNAEQAMPNGGNIFVATSFQRLQTALETGVDLVLPGNYIVVTVTDEGPGMLEEVRTRVCEPFFTTKGLAEHQGLGLTLVHGILKRIVGGLVLTSSPKGTAVSLYLPLVAPKNLDLPTPEDKGSPASIIDECVNTPNALSSDDANELGSGFLTSSKTTSRGVVSVSTATLQDQVLTEMQWQTSAIRRLWLAVGAVFTLGAVLSWVQLPTLSKLIAGILIPTLLLAIPLMYRCKLPEFAYRHGLVLVILLVGMTLLVSVTFASPAAIALVVLSILLSAELLGKNAFVFVALMVWLAFGFGGWVHSGTFGHLELAVLDPRSAASWLRMSLFLGFVLALVSSVVLHTVTSTRNQLERTAKARHRLEITADQRVQETEAALIAERISARAARAESVGRLTGSVAHDLNNCLLTMVGWAELLVELDDDPSIKGEATVGIEQSTDYAEALIQQLQQGNSERLPALSIDVGRALTGMQPMLVALLHRRGKTALKLLLHVESGCYVRVQEPSLRRIVLNLVANASDAMSSVGCCSVKLTLCPPEVVLEVQDDGCGMDETTLNRVAEAFFTTKGERGTGLGLHCVRELMRTTRGHLDITSKVGQGSKVSLRWPLSERPAVETRKVVRSESNRGMGSVLLVEDEPHVQIVLARTLTAGGYTVTTATDADDAMRRLEDGGIDLLCTDAIMPGRPTAELIEEFLSRFPGRPVVVMSGHLPSEFDSGLLSNPSVSFRGKPFAGKELLAEFERRLRG
jgi:signal transduction histidine kinase/CheY-like chemotaxis protein